MSRSNSEGAGSPEQRERDAENSYPTLSKFDLKLVLHQICRKCPPLDRNSSSTPLSLSCMSEHPSERLAVIDSLLGEFFVSALLPLSRS